MSGLSWWQEGDTVNTCRWLLFVYFVIRNSHLWHLLAEGSALPGAGLPGQGAVGPGEPTGPGEPSLPIPLPLCLLQGLCSSALPWPRLPWCHLLAIGSPSQRHSPCPCSPAASCIYLLLIIKDKVPLQLFGAFFGCMEMHRGWWGLVFFGWVLVGLGSASLHTKWQKGRARGTRGRAVGCLVLAPGQDSVAVPSPEKSLALGRVAYGSAGAVMKPLTASSSPGSGGWGASSWGGWCRVPPSPRAGAGGSGCMCLGQCHRCAKQRCTAAQEMAETATGLLVICLSKVVLTSEIVIIINKRTIFIAFSARDNS